MRSFAGRTVLDKGVGLHRRGWVSAIHTTPAKRRPSRDIHRPASTGPNRIGGGRSYSGGGRRCEALQWHPFRQGTGFNGADDQDRRTVADRVVAVFGEEDASTRPPFRIGGRPFTKAASAWVKRGGCFNGADDQRRRKERQRAQQRCAAKPQASTGPTISVGGSGEAVAYLESMIKDASTGPTISVGGRALAAAAVVVALNGLQRGRRSASEEGSSRRVVAGRGEDAASMGPTISVGGRPPRQGPDPAPGDASTGPPISVGGRATWTVVSTTSSRRFNGAADQDRRKEHRNHAD